MGVRGKDLVSTVCFLCVLSVPIPFHGDYIGLQRNSKLQKLKGGEEGAPWEEGRGGSCRGQHPQASFGSVCFQRQQQVYEATQ